MGPARTAEQDADRQRDGGEQVRGRQERRAHDLRAAPEPGERHRGGVPHLLGEHGDRPAGEAQREHVVAERLGVQQDPDDGLVRVGDGEREGGGGAERQRRPDQDAPALAPVADPERGGRADDEQQGRHDAAGEPADGEAHEPVPGRGQPDGDRDAEPVVRLLDQHPGPGRAPLHHGPGGGDQAADHHAQRHHPDHAGGGRDAQGRGERGRARDNRPRRRQRWW